VGPAADKNILFKIIVNMNLDGLNVKLCPSSYSFILSYSRQVTPNKAAQALAIASFLSSKTYKIFCTKRRKTPLKNLIG
jgi:hypothetical protein